MVGYAPTGLTLDFFCFDAAGAVWDGAEFAAWSAGSYASYRVAATELGGSGRYQAEAPAGTETYTLRLRAGTLAGSTRYYAGPDGGSAGTPVNDTETIIESDETISVS